MSGVTRRSFLQTGLAGGLVLAGLPARAQSRGARIVIVGGGFGGATCARYLRIWAPDAEVTLVEPASQWISCPLSNRVLTGSMTLRDLTRDYSRLAYGWKVNVVHDLATGLDLDKRQVALKGGSKLPFDRLVLSPGVEFVPESISGLDAALARNTILHAWKAGEQTLALRNRIVDLRSGGVIAIHIPKAPFRCPPGPYERISLIASHLKKFNPTAKILAFDSNPDILAKRDLFLAAWKGEYAGLIEYVPDAQLKAVAPEGNQLTFDLQGKVKADVVNVIPPQRAPALLRRAGLAPEGGAWCPVNFLSYESMLVPGVHVLGDAITSAPGLPKSAHMANQTAKICAAAIASSLAGSKPPTDIAIANTCYSFVNDQDAIHVAGVYRYDAEKKTMAAVKGAGGLSEAPTATEGFQAVAWGFNILNDTFG
jgi:NADPH-dependent 2,4-dienoyl-CoA reductase/sulfur reductase-like enzyme